MVSNFHHHLLLVALFATNLHLISAAAPTPSTSSPPPPPSSDFPQKQLNNIIDALIGAGDFAGWANLLSSSAAADTSSLPLTATLFIPSDDAVSRLPTAAATTIDPLIIPYHIVPQRLSFQELLRFATHSRLPTLLPSMYIVVTNNSPANFTVDDSRITHPDLYATAAFSVHGVDTVLDYAVYGDANSTIFPPPPDHASPAPLRPTFTPPQEEGAQPLSGGRQWGNASDVAAAACSSTDQLAIVFTLFCVAFAFKNI